MPDVGQSATASLLDMALIPDDAANATFPRFRQLPAELQIAIWDMAAASPVLTPEYAPIIDMFAIIDMFEGYNEVEHELIMADLMVLTSWSPLMHTCFDSRAAALRSLSLPLRFSERASFEVPCRRFDATIDALFSPFIDDLSSFVEAYMAHPLFKPTTQTECLIPLHLAEKMTPPRPSNALVGNYGYTEFRDANGSIVDPREDSEFDPCRAIGFRPRMRLVRITEPHENAQVVLPVFQLRDHEPQH